MNVKFLKFLECSTSEKEKIISLMLKKANLRIKCFLNFKEIKQTQDLKLANLCVFKGGSFEIEELEVTKYTLNIHSKNSDHILFLKLIDYLKLDNQELEEMIVSRYCLHHLVQKLNSI